VPGVSALLLLLLLLLCAGAADGGWWVACGTLMVVGVLHARMHAWLLRECAQMHTCNAHARGGVGTGDLKTPPRIPPPPHLCACALSPPPPPHHTQPCVPPFPVPTRHACAPTHNPTQTGVPLPINPRGFGGRRGRAVGGDGGLARPHGARPTARCTLPLPAWGGAPMPVGAEGAHACQPAGACEPQRGR